ncbi:MAG TPA: PspC domain-containing protein, partial [Chitinophagaceae bacterium]|nr:PspC domain-containing protein [Chitinophagaceae bacterium]
MKKIININLSGRKIPIEDTAYETLKGYLESLLHYFSREEGGDEIVSDIENRIAELFQEKLKKDTHCITDDDVSRMIATMGRPEQLEEEISTEPLEKEAASNQPKTHSQLSRNENDQLIGGVCSGIANYFKIDPAIVRIITFILIWAYGIGLLLYIVLWIVLPGKKGNNQALRKRLYRDPDNKVIGGVASGLGAYFKIDIVIPRIIFVLPLLGVIFTSIFAHGFNIWGFHHIFFPFSVGALPTFIVLYIVLWIAVPKAVTQAEKLEM